MKDMKMQHMKIDGMKQLLTFSEVTWCYFATL